MKPAPTTGPAASIPRGGSPRSRGSTGATGSPPTATSARGAGPPVPSTTEPFRMSSDQVTDSPRLRLRLALPRHTLGGGVAPPPKTPPQHRRLINNSLPSDDSHHPPPPAPPPP